MLCGHTHSIIDCSGAIVVITPSYPNRLAPWGMRLSSGNQDDLYACRSGICPHARCQALPSLYTYSFARLHDTNMNITKDTAVTLQYKVTNAKGKPLDSGTLAYLHGGYENIFPKVEAAFEGQAKGYAATVDLAVEDAFGVRDESLVRVIPKGEFPPGVKVGGQLRGANDKGEPQAYNVVKIKGLEVHLDGNHPLAGQALRFSGKVVDVRAATEEEITHRHVHGAHGHQH